MAWLILSGLTSFLSAMRRESFSISASRRRSCLVRMAQSLSMRCSLRHSTKVCSSSTQVLTSIEVFFWAGLSGEGTRSTGANPVGVLEIGKPAVAFWLPAGDDIAEFARLELGDVVLIGHA